MGTEAYAFTRESETKVLCFSLPKARGARGVVQDSRVEEAEESHDARAYISDMYPDTASHVRPLPHSRLATAFDDEGLVVFLPRVARRLSNFERKKDVSEMGGGAFHARPTQVRSEKFENLNV